MNCMGYKLINFVSFSIPNHFNTIVGAGTVGAGAGAALRYDSGSGYDQMIRLLAAPAPAPQH
jgi:hypothetical protein